MSDLKFAWDNNNAKHTIAWLHTNVLLSDGVVTDASVRGVIERKRGTSLVEMILRVPGVQDTAIDRYVIRVYRTQVIDWPLICRGVVQAVQSYCKDNNLEPEQTAEPSA